VVYSHRGSLPKSFLRNHASTNPRKLWETRVRFQNPLWYRYSFYEANFHLQWRFFGKDVNESTADESPSDVDEVGLEIVSEPVLTSQELNPPVNIIFVHGLGGSARGTWTHPESKAFWPLWLHKVKGLENPRIMTFGYDADWYKIWRPKNVLDITDFGDQLLNHLFLHYSKYGDVSSQY